MPNLKSVEIKAFIPARDFAQSLAFYQALGFELRSNDGEVAYLCHGHSPFLLQNYALPASSEGFMMHLLVENVDDWHAKVLASGVRERFGVRLSEPQNQPWGMRDFQMTDPSGVLWHIAQNLPKV